MGCNCSQETPDVILISLISSTGEQRKEYFCFLLVVVCTVCPSVLTGACPLWWRVQQLLLSFLGGSFVGLSRTSFDRHFLDVASRGGGPLCCQLQEFP